MNRKGQVFTWDLIFSSLIFLIMITSMVFIWDNALSEINVREEEYEMDWLSKTITKTLVMTSGTPLEWTPGSVQVYGLAKNAKRENSMSTLSHILDPNKFIYFVYDASTNYENSRKKILSSSKYHYYAELSCLNGSNSECFQGIKLDTVNFDIACVNGYTFTVTNFVSDSNRWIEAEDYFGLNGSCSPAAGSCSGREVSLVNGAGDVEFETNQGTYNVWVRCLEDPYGFKLRLNGIETGVNCNLSTSMFNWTNYGEFNLTSRTKIGFNSTNPTTEVDAILLTTNLGYNPLLMNPSIFGNPNNITTCIVGNFSSNPVSVVSSTKTASFNEQMTDIQLLSGNQVYLPKTIKIKVVVWKAAS
ncbi:MAG: hypothetical protein NTU61_04410 [Candidatus Altiarchaeota archaeon]|nr:hypothetical protein [Candidatus Altiarchaeota archaeon]